MTQVLLTEEKFVKGLVNIDENLANKYLRSALIEAQEIELREILGDCLLDTLKGMVQENTLEGMYNLLVEKCQYVLAYKAITNLCMTTTYKVANVGAVTTSDDNVTNLTWSDLVGLRSYYTHKADGFVYQLQTFLLQNKSAFPELKECDCVRIKSHLRTASTCGLWLGGVRGRKLSDCDC